MFLQPSGFLVTAGYSNPPLKWNSLMWREHHYQTPEFQFWIWKSEDCVFFRRNSAWSCLFKPFHASYFYGQSRFLCTWSAHECCIFYGCMNSWAADRELLFNPKLSISPALKILCICILQIGNNDIGDVNIIAFRQINQFDLSGNVITSSEHLPTLWVSVFSSSLWDFLHGKGFSSHAFYLQAVFLKA